MNEKQDIMKNYTYDITNYIELLIISIQMLLI